jgi:O-antigen/teichoic acid export membrane protein
VSTRPTPDEGAANRAFPELDEPLDGAPSPDLEAARPEPGIPRAVLKQKTAMSILWTVVRIGSDYFLSFVVFAVLARKLGPAAFGVFALAVAFAEVVKILPAAGLTSALQRAKDVSPTMADTVFWASLAVSVAGAGALALVARPIAAALGEPAVAPLLVALGLILPVSVAGATHIGLMLREFGHKSMASRSVVSGVLGGAAGLTAAYSGWGPWSLVVQRGVTEIAGTAMAWRAYPWLPGRRFSWGVLRELAGYGLSLTYSQGIFVALVRAQDVIIGRFLGTAAVGVYRTAWRTVDLIAQGVITPFAQVSLPTLGRLQSDLPAFRRAYLRISSVCAAIAFPAIIGFAVLARDAIPIVFGSRWAASADVAQVLGFMVIPFTLNRFAAPALVTLGRSRTLAKLSTTQLVLTIPLTLAATPYGLRAIAAAYVVRAYLTLPLQMRAFKRYSGLGYGQMLRAIAPPMMAAVLMAVALIGIERTVGGRFENRGLFLLCMISAGAAIYIGALLLFARRFVLEQIRDLRALLPGGTAKLSRAGA